MGLVRRVNTVDQRIEVALDDGERSPELMAHISEKTSPLFLAGLEPARHCVERARERASVARPSHAHSRREVTLGDSPHGLDYVSHWSGEPTKRSCREQEAVHHYQQG